MMITLKNFLCFQRLYAMDEQSDILLTQKINTLESSKSARKSQQNRIQSEFRETMNVRIFQKRKI